MKKKDQIKQLTRERDHARGLACEYEAEIAWMRGFRPPGPQEFSLLVVEDHVTPFDIETFLARARRIMEEPE